MAEIRIGKLVLDPAKNPAVLDTTTWDRAAAWEQVSAAGKTFWEQAALRAGGSDLPSAGGIALYPGSHASSGGDDVLLASLPDGQDVFVVLGKHADASVLGEPIGTEALAGGLKLAAYPTDMAVLDLYLKHINPEKAPRALGCVPRLGIGDRHTTAVWPAAFRAMEKGGFAANAIQNSLRELNLLEDLVAGKPAHENYLFSFGTIAEGHTGSTFEGLLQAGVMAALKAETYPRYGADADHIQVKRGPEGLDRAKRVITAARHYTFYTMDVSDILNYAAMKTESAGDAVAFLDSILASEAVKKDVVAYHLRKRRIGGRAYAFDAADIGRFVGKYWKALDAMEALHAHLKGLKGDTPFDMELSIDENPGDFATCECISSPEEVVFLAVEMQRRHLPITHIAPNFGVEKGTDYRCPDGLDGLEKRVRIISEIASAFNLMLDCHSGDDLGKKTRQVFGRATEGRINFKLSPMLQVMFAQTLYELQKETFAIWFADVLQFVRGEAAAGSAFAADCIAEYEADPTPHPDKKLFHYYQFVSVGRRDENNRFISRQKLYELGPKFLAVYSERLEAWLLENAEDVYGRKA
jgi:hypothetical protein